MIERRDEELSRMYRDADAPEPAQRVDDAILAASRRAAGARPRPAGFGFARRWGTPVALAATVVVTFTLTLMVFERQTGVDTMAPAATSADQPAKSAPVEQKPAAPAAAKPILKSEARRDAGGAFVPDVPGAAQEFSAPRRMPDGRQAPVPQSPRKSEQVPEPQQLYESSPLQKRERMNAPLPMQAAPAAPAPSPRTDAAATPPGAGTASGIAGRVAASEAKQRSPENWLEDIRRLKAQGKTSEVERELAEFKRRYPDYRLPEDLR
jgi:hypothetical protein